MSQNSACRGPNKPINQPPQLSSPAAWLGYAYMVTFKQIYWENSSYQEYKKYEVYIIDSSCLLKFKIQIIKNNFVYKKETVYIFKIILGKPLI